MSIPAYVVNWEELQLLIEDFLGELNYKNKTGIQGINKIKGFHVNSNDSEIEVVNLTVDKTILVDKIVLNDDNYDNYGNWEMLINDIKIFNNVKSNMLEEKTIWNTITPLNVGDKITIKFYNPNGHNVNLYVDFGYIDLEDRISGNIPEVPLPEIGTKYVISHWDNKYNKIKDDIILQDRAGIRKIVHAMYIENYNLIGGYIGFDNDPENIHWNHEVIAEKGLISVLEQSSGEFIPENNYFNFIYSKEEGSEVKDIEVVLQVRYLDLEGNKIDDDYYEIGMNGEVVMIDYRDFTDRNYVPVRLEIGKTDPLIVNSGLTSPQIHILERELYIDKNQFTYYYKKAPITEKGDD